MPSAEDHFANARNYSSDLLKKMKDRNPEAVRKVAEIAASNGERTAGLLGEPVHIDVDRLEAELRHLFSISAESATALDDDWADHEPWAAGKGTPRPFWSRYSTYLERDFGMAPDSARQIDDDTDMILERLEDPRRDPPWDRRGMVVGSVQAGKTANYTGLICKAVDAGYKLVIVLAGIHNNLRAQTQLRLDEGVLGFDTKKSRKLDTDSSWVGVGLVGERLVVHSLTSSEENGDFNKRVADNIGVMVGSDPVVLVVKKNSRLLGNLLRWVLHVAGSDNPATGRSVVKNVPLLLIDDEADNASINTRARPGVEDGDSVTAINGKIREILDAFEKSAYVGYTATPFANIFINPEAETPSHGEDLFPRSFIINIKPPPNHIGPSKVFGLDGDPDAGIEAGRGLPEIVKDIDDYAEAFPPKHKSDFVPSGLPESLRHAIRCFILTCAARCARGQDKKHNSMLVHVTRFTKTQTSVASLIRDELAGLQRRIEFGDGKRQPALLDELKAVWDEEFVPVTEALGDEAGAQVTWSGILPHLHAAASKIRVATINGFAKEALDYKDHEAIGRSVIVVGGDKLSRGLTLEGLSISYFLRTSRMYDTLLQMGRWFGYRPGYLDLCRLFTTRTLQDWYRHIALAEVELRREFDYMVAAGLTPENYGLRVRTHPDGMIVTAINKMSHGRTLELSWSGVLVQTRQLPKEGDRIVANLAMAAALLSGLAAPARGTGRETRVWLGVPAVQVARFVESLKFPPSSARASGEQLASFIRKQSAKVPAELTSWTVALVSNRQAAADRRRSVGTFEIGLIERNPEDQNETSFALKKANILNPGDEGLDFRDRAFDQEWFDAVRGKRELEADIGWLQDQVGENADKVALDLTCLWQEGDAAKIRKPANGQTNRPNGRVLRVLRRPQEGLLLIYPILPPQVVVFRDVHRRDVHRPPEPTGLDPAGPPIIGVALSFPTSETTLGVEYRVNNLWGAEMAEDDDYED